MYYDVIYIEENNIAQFMNEVEPTSAVRVEKDGCYWTFEFTSAEDYEQAQKWDYAHNIRLFMNNDYIYFDTNSNSYGFCVGGKLITGFKNPDAAEDAYIDWLEQYRK